MEATESVLPESSVDDSTDQQPRGQPRSRRSVIRQISMDHKQIHLDAEEENCLMSEDPPRVELLEGRSTSADISVLAMYNNMEADGIEETTPDADENQVCLDQWRSVMDNHRPLITCSVCGTYGPSWDDDVTKVFVPVYKLDCLRLTSNEEQDYLSLDDIQKRARHVTKTVMNDGKITYYYMCMEGVDCFDTAQDSTNSPNRQILLGRFQLEIPFESLIVDETVSFPHTKVSFCSVCLHCHKNAVVKGIRSPHMFATADLGRVPRGLGGLPDLSPLEQLCISRYVCVCVVVKRVSITQNGFRQVLKHHVITLPLESTDDVHESAVACLPRKLRDVEKYFKLVFIGKKNSSSVADWKNRVHNTAATRLDPDKVLKWLRFLVHSGHPGYTDVEVEDDSETLRCEMKAIQHRLHDDTDVITGGHALNMERLAAADVAAATFNAHEDTVQDAEKEKDHLDPMDTRHFVVSTSNQAQAVDTLEAVKELCFSEKKNVSDTKIRVGVGTEPINEFDSNPALLGGAFPHLFPLGLTDVHLGGKGTISNSAALRLFHFYDQRFSVSTQFLFTCFSQKLRHQACNSVSATVSANSDTSEKFKHLVNEPNFREQIEAALADPDSPTSKELVSTVLSAISLSSRYQPFSVAERKETVKYLSALCQSFGTPSYFITFSPAFSDNPFAVRMAMRSSDSYTFHSDPLHPQCSACDGRGEHIFRWDDPQLAMPAKPDRGRLITNDPVSEARIFQMMCSALIEKLFGLQYDRNSKRTPLRQQRRTGCLGKALAIYGVTEAQSRGSLHFHGLLFGGVTPDALVRAYLDDKGDCTAVAEALDSVISACISAPVQAEAAARQKHNLIVHENDASGIPHSDVYMPAPRVAMEDPPVSVEAAQLSADRVNVVTNVHTHTSACRPKRISSDVIKCRFAMQRRQKDMTSATYLYEVATKSSDEDSITRRYFEWKLLGDDSISDRALLHAIRRKEIETPTRRFFENIEEVWSKEEEQYCVCQFVEDAVGGRCTCKSGVLIFNIQRGVSDTMQVEANHIISSAIRANTCISFQGGKVQGKCSIIYTAKYMGKNPAEPKAILPLIHEGILLSEKYGGSTAEDAGTYSRNAKYILSRLVNQVSSASEFSLQQAALYVQGYDSFYSSHKFWTVYPHSSIAFRKMWALERDSESKTDPLLQGPPHSQQEEKIHMSISNSEEDDEDFTDDSDNLRSDQNHDNDEQPSSIFDTQGGSGLQGEKFFKLPNGNLIPYNQVLLYAHRGPKLQNLSLMEYVCIIGVFPKASVQMETADTASDVTVSTAEKVAAPGRKQNAVYEFDAEAPFRSTHIQKVRSKLYVPVVAGKLPKHPDYDVLKLFMNSNGKIVPPDSGDGDMIRLYEREMIRANKFAEVFGSLFVPFSKAHDDGMLWETFTDTVLTWCRPGASWLNRQRYNFFLRMCENMSVLESDKRIISFDRFLHADVLGELNADEVRTGGGGIQDSSEDLTPTLEDTKALQQLMYAALQVNESTDDHYAHLVNLERTATDVYSFNNDINSTTSSTPTDLYICDDQTYECHRHLVHHHAHMNIELASARREQTLLEDAEIDTNADPSPSSEIDANRVPSETVTDVASPRINGGLNSVQQRIYDTITSELDDDSRTKQLLAIIDGPPGTGKTHLIKTVPTEAKKVFFCAFTASAAALHTNGFTIHSLFSISVGETAGSSSPSKSNSAARLQKVRGTLGIFGTASPNPKDFLFVVDEISQVSCQLLIDMHTRLQQVFSNTTDSFGGVHMILLGDCFQMECTSGPSLFEAVVSTALSNLPKSYSARATMMSTAASLFVSFRRFSLEEQMRAANDMQHRQTILALRNTNVEYPFTSGLRNRLLRLQLRKQVSDSAFRFAIVGVTSNAERALLNYLACMRWAQFYNKPLFLWYLPINGTTSYSVSYCSKHPILRAVFVAGAPCIVDKNLNREAGVFNGSKATFHSLTTKDGELFPSIHHDCFQVITLSEPPATVNVLVDDPRNPNGEPHLQKIQARYEDVTLPGISPTAKQKKMGTSSIKRTTLKLHSVSPLFAVTFHKLQGQTLPKVVLMLNKKKSKTMPDVTLTGLHVGLTRVQAASDMRIWPVHDTQSDTNYLLSLRYPSYLVLWNSAYNKNGVFNKQLILDVYKQRRLEVLQQLCLDPNDTSSLVSVLQMRTKRVLQESLRRIFLPVSGNKVELITRLHGTLADLQPQATDSLLRTKTSPLLHVDSMLRSPATVQSPVVQVSYAPSYASVRVVPPNGYLSVNVLDSATFLLSRSPLAAMKCVHFIPASIFADLRDHPYGSLRTLIESPSFKFLSEPTFWNTAKTIAWVNHVDGNHWSVTVLDLESRQVKYFDSLLPRGVDASSRAEPRLLIVSTMAQLAVENCTNAHRPTYDLAFSTWPFMVVKVHSQNNGVDCGMFAFTYLASLLYDCDVYTWAMHRNFLPRSAYSRQRLTSFLDGSLGEWSPPPDSILPSATRILRPRRNRMAPGRWSDRAAADRIDHVDLTTSQNTTLEPRTPLRRRNTKDVPFIPEPRSPLKSSSIKRKAATSLTEKVHKLVTVQNSAERSQLRHSMTRNRKHVQHSTNHTPPPTASTLSKPSKRKISHQDASDHIPFKQVKAVVQSEQQVGANSSPASILVPDLAERHLASARSPTGPLLSQDGTPLRRSNRRVTSSQDSAFIYYK